MSSDKTVSRKLYPICEPYDTGRLSVDDIHTVYYEQCGKQDGNPVIFIHGGPGGGCMDLDRGYFDPAVYRIILLDQRGAGKSTPAAELENNTTWHLVEDLEILRKHLKIDKWVVFGGSWGSTLALLYAETYPDRVKAMILRGIFLCTQKEINWLYQEGTGLFYPDFYEDYIDPIPEDERHNLVPAFYKRLTGDDEQEKLHCARAWSRWESATSKLIFEPCNLKKTEEDLWVLQFARIECHYFINKGWLADDYILKNTNKIMNIPTTIVQGRYDMVCPPEMAWKLYRKLKKAEIFMVPDAGHSSKETGTVSLLIQATDKYKHL